MIVPMKKIELFALKEDEGRILHALQRSSVFMATEPCSDARASKPADTEKLANAERALSLAKKYSGKNPFFTDRRVVTYEELTGADAEAERLTGRAAEIAQEIGDAKRRIESLEALSEQLEPWQGLDIPVQEIKDTRYASFKTGFISPDAIPALEKNEISVKPLSNSQQGTAVLLAYHRDNAEQALRVLKESGFSEAQPPDISGTPDEEQRRISGKIEDEHNSIAGLEQEAAKAAADIDAIELNRDRLATERALDETPVGETETTFFLEGYVAADKLETLKKTLDGVTEHYELDARDPLPEEAPPTETRNSRFIAPFETITNMLSRPDPRGVDPNPVMGPWYWLIFGMMMGDAGYGVVMAVLFTLFLKIKKPRGEFGKLVKVLLFCSVTTIFWGVMFGSYFGAEWFPPVLFLPLDDPLRLMIICLVVGALHIFSGMIVKMYDLIRQGHILDALFDELSWILLISGLGLLFVPALKTVGTVLAAVGAGTVLLTAGREKKGVFGKATGGLLGLYGISSYVSDILSYARILALMLSSGVVALVMNLLAGMVRGDPPTVFGFIASLLVYFAGHAFNLAMGLLSAYVHASRLQYIEFFGKFYDGGGYEFKPLAPDTQYVDVAQPTQKSDR